MLEPLVTGFNVAILVMFFVFLGAVSILPNYGYPPRKALKLACILSAVLFIPSCFGISLLVEFVRNGRFTYQTAIEITDPKVKLPPSATDITLFKYASGHDARFKVSNADLSQWLESNQANRKENRPDGSFGARVPAHFSKYGWPSNDDENDLEEYSGPIAETGAGFDIWYSPKNGTAYLHCGYW
ncbi:MAG: hypothetical protein JSS02_32545 [Planctomycetes bacterium]|nr:hypothetical protein [Planctomycetota bacterium]